MSSPPDDAPPAKDEASIQERVRKALKETRRLPADLRWTLAAAGVATAAWGAWVAFCFLLGHGPRVLGLAGLILAVGREPAMLSAYTMEPRLPLWVVAVAGVLQDVAAVLLSLALLAWVFRRLRHIRPVARALSGVETQAMEKRHWVSKWGLWGIIGFYFLPGFGSGAVTACALGLLAGLPLRRLAIGLSAGGFVVSLFWAVALYFASYLVPSGPWSKWLPVAFLALVIGAAGVNAWRRRGQAPIMYLDWRVRPDERHRKHLEEHGIDCEAEAVVIELRKLSRATGIPVKDLPALRAAGEMLLVDGVTPTTAKALTAMGVRGIEDMAGLDPPTLVDALASKHQKVSQAQAKAWHEEALRLRRRHDA